jgi:amylosucrase
LQDPRQVAYVTYVDNFAGTLRGVEDHLDHLESLHVTHLHLMPLLEPRPGDSDGGYAVQDYRAVREDLGTMQDLARLGRVLHRRGMSVELDLVLNHVAREHEWARRARAGEQRYRDYFLTYPDRGMPDQWERSLPEVFPDFAPGNFTWDEDMGRWVWTTFNDFQWDLNWANPDVFCEFLEIILFLANQGVDVLRLDAIAFTWKRMGTNCQNQSEVHLLTRALRAAVRIAAPAVAFKAEAIVGPQDLVHYLGTGENAGKVSDMAYHNSLMVQLWSSLACRDTRLLRIALDRFPAKPASTTWSTYARCHDDIGWAITDEDAADAGLNGFAHRAFLSAFYSDEYPGSFAEGLVFQSNPATGDKRISGSLAALAGLARAAGDPRATDLAVRRILLLHAVVLGFGGLPLLYMADEIASLGDPDWAADPAHTGDNRWVHRPRMDWDAVARVEQELTDASAGSAAESGAVAEPGSLSPAARVLSGLRSLIEVRARTPQVHASVESEVLDPPDPRLLVLRRDHAQGILVQICSFAEDPVRIDPYPVRAIVGSGPHEAITGHDWDLRVPEIEIAPYQVLWFLQQD